MIDRAHPSPRAADPGPQQLFAGLGFAFVHRFLWLVLSSCGLLAVGGLALAWCFEGDVTVRARGVVQPRKRTVVKSRLDGVVQEVRVRDGDRVDEGDILIVLSPREVRARIRQVEEELALSDTRAVLLEAQIGHERRSLEAVLELRRLEVERAAFVLEQVRSEQQLYSERAPAEWKRRALAELVPVREAASALQLAEAQRNLVRRQLEAAAGRLEEVDLERRQWAKLDRERVQLWSVLEHTVLRAPAAGVVLTHDLDLRRGDRVRVGQALLELSVAAAWRARVLVSQIDRPKLAPGQRARVFVDAFPHLEFGSLAGEVVSVAEQPDAAGADYPVDIALQETVLALSDGMAAEARVSVDSGRLLDLVWRRVMRQLGHVPAPQLRETRS